MSLIRNIMDKQGKYFKKGRRLARLQPLYEAIDTFVYTPSTVTPGASHVRDALDLKRVMSMVVLALIPCMCMAMYNTGLQANLILAGGLEPVGWRADLVSKLGLGFSSDSIPSCFIHVSFYFIPVLIVTFSVVGSI